MVDLCVLLLQCVPSARSQTFWCCLNELMYFLLQSLQVTLYIGHSTLLVFLVFVIRVDQKLPLCVTQLMV